MEYEAKQAVYLPVVDFLQLELHLLDTRPGTKPEAFVTELVKRWLLTETEKASLRENGPALRGFNGKHYFCSMERFCERAITIPSSSRKSKATASLPTMACR